MSRSWFIAVIVALSATAWLASGMLSDGPAVPVTNPSLADEPMPQVRVQPLVAEPMVDTLTLNGHTVADRTVELKVGTTGTVADVLVDRGATVDAGDPLIQLAADERAERLAEAHALLAQREIEFEAASKLNRQGYQTDTALAEARAGLDAARAQAKLAEIEIARTTVTAPFAGIIDVRPVEVGDYLQTGDPVATLVDLDPIRVRGQVSERYAGQIAPGTKGSVRLLDGSLVAGKVSYIGRIADPGTRTVPIELVVPNPDASIIAGVTAELNLPVAEILAHRVPPSVLTLADDGTLGVKAVSDDGTVTFHPVRFLGDGADGVWVGGLPERLSLITVGQEFVTAGQKVTALPVGQASAGDSR